MISNLLIFPYPCGALSIKVENKSEFCRIVADFPFSRDNHNESNHNDVPFFMDNIPSIG